jgi:hypothetical protein
MRTVIDPEHSVEITGAASAGPGNLPIENIAAQPMMRTGEAERGEMAKTNRPIREQAAGSPALNPREEEALRLLRQLNRAQSRLPKAGPRKLRQGNRYIAG